MTQVTYQVMSIRCEEGVLEILRADHLPTHKDHECAVCGKRISVPHFAYLFKFQDSCIARLVVRACCNEHREKLEEALAVIELELTDPPEILNVSTVWKLVKKTFREHGINAPHLQILAG